MTTHYVYPTEEKITDQAESAFDSGKRHREISLINSASAYNWSIGLDFGAGIGRNIDHIANAATSQRPTKILAYEPDVERANTISSNIAAKVPSALTEVVVDRREVERWLREHRENLDLVLACQVFTHTSTDETEYWLHRISDALSKTGAIVLCVPFHVGCASDDYFHLVSHSGNGTVERIQVSRQEFNSLSQHPNPGVLPVRAMRASGLSTPVGLRDLPTNVEIEFVSWKRLGLRVVTSLVYSVHEQSSEGAIIGDVIVKVVKDVN